MTAWSSLLEPDTDVMAAYCTVSGFIVDVQRRNNGGALNNFILDSVVIPQGIEADKFRIRPMTINDVVKDYDAVMSSVDHLNNCAMDLEMRMDDGPGLQDGPLASN